MERYQFYPDASLYFVTFSVVEWLPVFVTSGTCQIIVDSLSYCHEHKHLENHAYVIMPTHIHAIVSDHDRNTTRLEETLIDFRKFTGRRLADVCAQRFPACFSEAFRQAAGEDRERRFWQPTRHPVAIESEMFWLQKLNYLHENPCRKGLVRRAGDWRYSSAAYYLTDRAMECDVKITRVVW